jgi:hypothetical protein
VDVQQLRADPPGAHLDSQGNRVPWQVASRILEIIDAHVGSESVTLETGAGFSTGMFAIKGSDHTCIVPWTSERDRLHAWAERVGVSMDRVHFECERSENVLPRLEPTPLDFVLIDGGHGFPTPFIDWFYAGRRLKRGGLLAVDDTELWTGRVLSQYLKEQEGWEVVESLPLRSVVFRRTSEPSDDLEEWVDQPFSRKRSYVGGYRGLIRKAVRATERVRTSATGRN